MALVEALDTKVIDQKWLGSFAALDPAVLATTSAVMQSVATGQYAIAPFMALIVSDNAERLGAPVAFWYLKEGNPVVPTSAGVLAAAPHPKSAELFVSWLLSDSSQKISATLGQIGTLAERADAAGLSARNEAARAHRRPDAEGAQGVVRGAREVARQVARHRRSREEMAA